jgi:diguanylate cyclase (GGDEF)-like protein
VLAWIDPAGDRFVFVNRRGLESRDLHLREFTDLVNGGRARLLEEYDAPLLDRVSERMAHSAHSRIAAEAQQDELTSLVNRRGFERSLKGLLDASRNGDSSHCVLQVDLDGFGMVNSVLGTDGGDRLLREVALALTGIAEGHEAVIGRIGADQFGMLLYRTSVAEGLDVAERIVGAIRELEFAWQERECKVCATVAVLGTDSATESVGQILRNLDSSCRSGKQHGGDRACVYTEDSEEIRAQRAVLQVAAQVEAWLAAGRVQLTVQMIAPANRNSTLQGHYEILIAVADDAGVAGSPVRFIEAAERHGKMPMVDRYVVARALDWIGRHPQALEDVSGLSINLSGQSINHEGFLGYVLGEFEKSGAPPHKVCFEITETAAIGNMSRAIEFMQKLKVMGCRFALDDFGSGMSSYGYLRKLPVDYLKIDGSFVKNMVTDEGDQAVVRSINEIGHFFGKKTVAEYVHDEATRRLACELGIDYLQGWGIEKPKPIDSLLLPILEAGSLVG